LWRAAEVLEAAAVKRVERPLSPGLIDFDNYVNPLAYLPISVPIGYTSIEESIALDTTVFDT
jgi:hypothetical protein